MLLADLTHFGVEVAQGVRPVAGSPLGDVHGFQRIFAGVPVNFTAGHRDTRGGFQFFRNRNRDFGVPPVPSGTDYLVPNLKHISLLAGWLDRMIAAAFGAIYTLVTPLSTTGVKFPMELACDCETRHTGGIQRRFAKR